MRARTRREAAKRSPLKRWRPRPPLGTVSCGGVRTVGAPEGSAVCAVRQSPVMTYGLAVREGIRPSDDAAAGRPFSELPRQYTDADTGGDHPPAERVAAHGAALLQRRPDTDEDDVAPWCSGPLIDEASGPPISFGLRWAGPKKRPHTPRGSPRPRGWSALTSRGTGPGRSRLTSPRPLPRTRHMR